MTLTRCLPRPHLVDRRWLDELPDALRPAGTPTLLWWRLHEPPLAVHWAIPALHARSLSPGWRRACVLPPDALSGVARRVLGLASGTLMPVQGRLPRTIDPRVTEAVLRAGGDDAAAVFLLACSRAEGEAPWALARLRFDPACSGDALDRCRESLGESDLRLGTAVMTALLMSSPQPAVSVPAEARV